MSNTVEWACCVGVCTDGAKVMLAKHRGLIAHVKRVCPSIHWLHGHIHRKALAAKNMPDYLLAVLNDSVKTGNFKLAPYIHGSSQ